MKAVILAGGLGTRLSEETDRIPKPMVEIGGKPILWHIMKTYAHHGVRDFIVCLGYKGYLVKEYFSNFFLHNADITVELASGEVRIHDRSGESEDWRVTMVDTGSETQTGGRLRRVRKYLDDQTFCMTYGDGVSDIDLTAEFAFHQQHGRKATVSAITPPGRFGLLEIDGDKVKGFAEKVDYAEAKINGGFFVLEPSVIEYIDEDLTIWERQPLERIAKEGELMAFHHAGFWQPMDTLRDRRNLEELWASGAAPWAVWQ
jgi:glucose-1-phosphate cytidylyltransferase